MGSENYTPPVSPTGEAMLRYTRIAKFPDEENHRHSLHLFEGKLKNSFHLITLGKAGYYGVYIHNNHEVSWKNTLLGNSSMPLQFDYTLCEAESIDPFAESSENPFAEDIANRLKLLEIENKQMEQNCSSSLNHSVHAVAPSIHVEPSYFDDRKHSDTTNRFRMANVGKIKTKANEFKCFYVYCQYAGQVLHIVASSNSLLGSAIQCSYSISYCENYCKVPARHKTPYLRNVAILSIDAGCGYGVAYLRVLSMIELELQKLLKNDGVRLIDCFDFIAGSNAGGIICLGLLARKSISEIMEFWKNDLLTILANKEKSRAKELHQVMMCFLGDKFLTSFAFPYCFVTSTEVMPSYRRKFLLRNYEHFRKEKVDVVQNGFSQLPLWLAGCATAFSTNPSKKRESNLFEEMGYSFNPKLDLDDGSDEVTNPSLIALDEAAALMSKNSVAFIKEDLDILLSIGIGPQFATNQKAATKDESITHNEPPAHPKTKTCTTHRDLLETFAKTDCRNYWRFNTPFITGTKAEIANTEVLSSIEAAATSYCIEEKFFDIKTLVNELANRLKEEVL